MGRQADPRRAILEATLDLLEQHAGAPLAMETVARAAGMSRQALYLHFPSKTALLLATVEHGKTKVRFGELLAPVVNAPDGESALDALIALHVEFTPRVLRFALAF